MTVDLLVSGGTVISMDHRRRLIDDGAIAIANGRIVAVGTRAAIEAAHPARKTIDARDMAILPGFIDCHAHAGHALVKSLGADQGSRWEDACEVIYTRASPPSYWGAEAGLAALERLRFGVTCGVSLLGGGDSVLRTDSVDHAGAHCEAVLATGIRTMLAVGPARGPFPRLYGDGGPDAVHPVSFETQVDNSRQIIREWQGAGDGRIRVAVVSPTLRDEHLSGAPDEARRLLDEQARHARALSRDEGALFTQDGHTTGSVTYAQHLDLLGPDALLSHSTDLCAAEIDICARTDTRIAHNPSAIASIHGRCPVPELLDAGVTVGLGSDATAPDRSGDMLRHMQQCMHYHRRHFRDSAVLPPGKVLEMATIDAARALGLESEIGSLEAGKRADLVLIDLRRPHLYPPNMPLYRVVYYANGNDVHTVIVGGRVLMRDRRVESVDEDAILDRARFETERMIERTGLGSALDMPDRLFGHSHY